MKKILRQVIKNGSSALSLKYFEQSDFLKSLLELSDNNLENFSFNLASKIQKDNYPDYLKTANYLDTDVQYLKGVGPKRALILKSRGIHTIGDVLNIIPNNYRDLTEIRTIENSFPGKTTLIKVKFRAFNEIFYQRRKVLQAVFFDDSSEIILKWFHFKMSYLKNYFIKDTDFIVYGKVRYFNNFKEIIHPSIEKFSDFKPGIIPVYPSVGGINGKILESMIRTIIEKIDNNNYEYLPANIMIEKDIEEIVNSYKNLHFPERLLKNNEKFLHRLIYDEFFFTMIGISKEKYRKEALKTHPVKYRGNIIEPFLEALPFKLTESQRKVLREIFSDFKKGKVLNRLLQGDVGSGKTLVALITALAIIENRAQAAFMAPTEILAEQHYKNFLKYDLPINIALLTGSTLKRKKEEICKKLETGEIDLIIGTHALIVEKVNFKNLKLNIVDEQHKFGVKQRLYLKQKGSLVHTLIMTATPIPRTLTLTLYGDLDVSVIEKLPPGRKPVKTYWFRENMREKFLKMIKEELAKGRQAYFVYPLIDESDKLELKSVMEMEDKLKKYFAPDFSVKVLHGKMKAKEKDDIMQKFAKGEINVLISTTVIEVGIDVSNATVIVIENAERFGLSQLHQLRGRVGRGKEQSFCFLISKNRVSKEASERLKVMVSTTDGFKIAEADFKIRGGGEIAGTKQSGIPEFKFGDLLRDFNILLSAKNDADRLVEFNSNLEKFPALKHKFEKFIGEKTHLITTG